MVNISLTFLALGVFKSFLIIPSYQADAMLQIEEKSNPLDALAPVSSHKPGQCE